MRMNRIHELMDGEISGNMSISFFNYQLHDIQWLYYLWSEKLVVTRTACYRFKMFRIMKLFQQQYDESNNINDSESV